MRVLVLYAHPVAESFIAALQRAAVEALRAAGHEVDLCDLYAEGFNPVLSRDERVGYHDLVTNRAPVAAYVERVLAAEALVLCHPVWNFGYPAILKGFFDRVFLPGVSFRMENGQTVPNLGNIRKLGVVATYGAARWRAFLLGDPPRKNAMNILRRMIAPGAPARYLALYDMNRAGKADREAFLSLVDKEMRRF
ncbi:NAD(P)H-dependent oxidoreductase [Terrarubrum flagellatum]|uniref:NAD(P)H-dependent oxidoreductase n=1 Tax=Terrirubrum flagellatum TaxID=2895980 RepID=UPI003144FCEC